jgi:hypothetical protein
MRPRLPILVAALIGLAASTGCDLAIKNGVFACGQPADCPSGYFCWATDNRCYDAQEPTCEPKQCEQVIAEFATLGITVECGTLPDGCDGSIECGGCPAGSTCGANGQNFICGCEEVTCATASSEGAECGDVPTRCGEPGETIDCGLCLGDGQVCNEAFQCECPPGEECDDGCFGLCQGDQVCVDGVCCEPTYPCSDHECSPPGGLPDGCGSTTVCPPCSGTAECVLTSDSRYECVEDCTCEAKGIECGQEVICGELTLCGSCAANGFGQGYRCEQNRCVCEDPFEVNDSFDDFALICGPEIGGVNCFQEAWSVDVQASLHSKGDIDYYAIQALDSWTPVVAEAYNGTSDRLIGLTYLCPDGWPGLTECSGWIENIKGIDFCVSNERSVAIGRDCPASDEKLGMVLVGVEPIEFRGDCDAYGLKVIASYGGIRPL